MKKNTNNRPVPEKLLHGYIRRRILEIFESVMEGLKTGSVGSDFNQTLLIHSMIQSAPFLEFIYKRGFDKNGKAIDDGGLMSPLDSLGNAIATKEVYDRAMLLEKGDKTEEEYIREDDRTILSVMGIPNMPYVGSSDLNTHQFEEFMESFKTIIEMSRAYAVLQISCSYSVVEQIEPEDGKNLSNMSDRDLKEYLKKRIKNKKEVVMLNACTPYLKWTQMQRIIRLNARDEESEILRFDNHVLSITDYLDDRSIFRITNEEGSLEIDQDTKATKDSKLSEKPEHNTMISNLFRSSFSSSPIGKPIINN